MAGFDRNSGPGGPAATNPQIPFGNFTPPSFPTHPPRPIRSSPKWGDGQNSFQSQQRPPAFTPFDAFRDSGTGFPAKSTPVHDMKRTRSPTVLSTNEDHLSNTRTVMGSNSDTWRTQSPPSNLRNYHSLDDPSGPSFSEVQRPDLSSPEWPKLPNQHKLSSNFPHMQPQQDLPSTAPYVGIYDSTRNFPAKHTDAHISKRTRSPPLKYTSGLSREDDPFSRNDSKRPALPSPEWPALPNNRPKLSSNFPNRLTQQNLPATLPNDSYDSERNFPSKLGDVHGAKRNRSPPLQYTRDSSWEASGFAGNDSKRPVLSPPRLNTRSNDRFNIPDAQHRQLSPPSTHVMDVVPTKPTNTEVPKSTRPPLPSYDQVFLGNAHGAEVDIERELQLKAKRLSRFKDELSQPEKRNLGVGNQKVPAMQHNQFSGGNRKLIVEPLDMTANFPNGNASSEYEGKDSSSIIIGFCPDMCPETERGERERKGDLDQYERLDGDRNQTTKYLAVKKYTRTAERESDLIRAMPVLQKTLDYLLNLLDQPYDDRLLGLYNFLWDRMRAIRMDLRMQHIFDLEAISMLEQMIRLHILAMHELCEYTKGEGFSEGFDAHLNIEQMNKTSVELFQLYDDHRKRGIDTPTEKEFRGYYALLKLDKHPGYKVEPAELSLDLAKMTPEIRQTSEVLFARDVARACRTGNFIAFFRLARKASYLQACLMHAHFAKLRSQALVSVHSGLQNNQGIPVSHVAKWLAMEEEDIESLMEYHGFSMKEYEEPYMVKEGPFITGDDYPLRCSKLVHEKKSQRIVENVSSPCPMKPLSSKKVEKLPSVKINGQKPPPVLSCETERSFHAIDDEMPDYEAVSSPKDVMNVKPVSKQLVVNQWSGKDHLLVASVSPLPSDFSLAHKSPQLLEARMTSEEKPKYDTRFRNSLEKNKHSDMNTEPLQIMTQRMEPDVSSALQMNPPFEKPLQQPVFVTDIEIEEHTSIHEEVENDEVSADNDSEEVAEAKLRLILRIWRRRSLKKRELREQKQLAANAALSSLSMGTPIWIYSDGPSISGEINIDSIISERYDKQEQSWSTLNVSDVVAAKLSGRNPSAKCLCWKMILYSQTDNSDQEQRGQISHLSAGYWLRSKLMPSSNNNDDNMVISCNGLSIWKKWVYSDSDSDMACCLSVIKDINVDNMKETVTGASAVLFVVSECIPWELQKTHLHNLLICLPSGSRLPLLILSGSMKDDSDPSAIARGLGLHEVDQSRVSTFSVIFLSDGFFSDTQLREGLQWLASKSPLQPILQRVNPRELVITHMNPTLDVLDSIDAYPDHCISALNEALDRSIEEVFSAANTNPSGWPCPEITLLEDNSNEWKPVKWYLPSTGWSSSERIEPLLQVLRLCKLPTFRDDMSWLCSGSNTGNDIENQVLRLEGCLVRYLTESTQIMGLLLAKHEAHVILQKCARLELRNLTYYIVPNWVMIFRRILNWQLMNLSDGDLSTAYILEHKNVAKTKSQGLDKLYLEGGVYSSYNIIPPSLDEMVEVGCSSPYTPRLHNSEHKEFQHLSATVSRGREVQKAINETESMEEERNFVEDGRLAEANEDNLTNNSNALVVAAKATKEADRLSKLLERCNIVQNMIDKKLSIYF